MKAVLTTKKVIIFDFDGVLADSFDYLYSLIKDGMKHIGLSFTKDQYRDLFIGNIHQGFKNFINDEIKYPAFAEFRKANFDRNYYNEERGVKLFPEAPAFLKKISKKYILTIASSGQKITLETLLKKNRIRSLFSLILANTATTKEETMKEILNKFRVNPRQTFFITDTVGDIKAAKKIGLKTIAVTWGFHNINYLVTAKPDNIASSFKILESMLQK